MNHLPVPFQPPGLPAHRERRGPLRADRVLVPEAVTNDDGPRLLVERVIEQRVTERVWLVPGKKVA